MLLNKFKDNVSGKTFVKMIVKRDSLKQSKKNPDYFSIILGTDYRIGTDKKQTILVKDAFNLDKIPLNNPEESK